MKLVIIASAHPFSFILRLGRRRSMDGADARSDDCARDGDGPHAVYEGQRKATNHATATDGRLRVQRDPLQITQAPVIVYTCHCTDCQRITSSAFSLGMVIPDE
jgi:hypothetical protein